MDKLIRNAEVIKELIDRQNGRSLRKFAKEIHCSASYICDIYKGRRDPGPMILKYLGLKKVVKPWDVEFERIR